MERIASFQVDHIRLNRGLYVSRIDEINGNYLTSFDIRMKLPNREPVINIAELHTMEHLGATFLRNHPVWKNEIVYFGPMGCRTGFYLILKGKLESKDIIDLMKELYKFMAEFVENEEQLDLTLFKDKKVAKNLSDLKFSYSRAFIKL